MDGSSETWSVSECQKPSTSFHFDIYEIFKVETNGTGSGIQESDIPEPVRKVTKAIKAVSTTMIAMFCCAIAATIVTFFIGWFGLLSRWGSCVTTILADVSEPGFVPPYMSSKTNIPRLHSCLPWLPAVLLLLSTSLSRKASIRV